MYSGDVGGHFYVKFVVLFFSPCTTNSSHLATINVV